MVDYREAGVDVGKSDAAKKAMGESVRSTFNRDVLTEFGLFGGAVSLRGIKSMDKPVLVASVDGVGTKLKIARMANDYSMIGFDIVGHSVNDVLVQGARPFAFLDYLASAKLQPSVMVGIVKSMSEACRQHGIPLLGGETAQMPGVYEPGEIDVVGCIIGIVDEARMVLGRKVKEGDVLLGLPSNGLHTNGYSLARKIVFDIAGLDVMDKVEGIGPIGKALLQPHTEYASVVLPLLEKYEIHAMSHITGGGFQGNLGRGIPKGLGVEVRLGSWPVPKLFSWLQKTGNVPQEEMYRTFNMGIGFVLIVPESAKEGIKKAAKAYEIGRIVKGQGVRLA